MTCSKKKFQIPQPPFSKRGARGDDKFSLFVPAHRSAVFRHTGVGDVTVMKDCSEKIWSGQRGSNPRPSAWEADALPTELCPPDPFLKQSMLRNQNIKND
jgi:hypothetical protein